MFIFLRVQIYACDFFCSFMRVFDIPFSLNEAENVKLTLKSEVKSLSAQLGDLQKKW